MFRDDSTITVHRRIIFYAVFTAVSLFGGLLLLLIRHPEHLYLNIDESLTETDLGKLTYPVTFTPKEAFLQSFHLLKKENYLLLLFIFAYTGFEITFYSGVYGTSVGQTAQLGNNAIGYVGLSGVMIGIGEISSCLIIGGISRMWKRFTPDLIIVIGLFVHIICFYLIYLSFPFHSPQRPSNEITYITPRLELVLLCGYLLGFGDSIFNTQIMALLAEVYTGIDSPASFAVYNFIQTMASGIGFFYSTSLTMQWQLLIMSISGLLGTISFIFVEHRRKLSIHPRNIEVN